MVNIIKKNGELQKFNGEKIKRAIRKSAEFLILEIKLNYIKLIFLLILFIIWLRLNLIILINQE